MYKPQPQTTVSRSGVQVLDRVLDILDLLAKAEYPLSLAKIANMSGLSKSTVHRLLSALQARDYVEKLSDATYRLGIKVLEIASYHINTLELLTESRPHLNALHRSLNLSSHLGLLEDYQVVYIGLVNSASYTKYYAQVGKRSPAFCSSMGKCLLAGLSKTDLDETLNHIELKAYTERTITDPRSLRRHLAEVRNRGWAMDNEEYQEGQRCIGAPVFDYRGDSLAAISVSGQVSHISDDRVEEIARQVKNAALLISQGMGYSV
ncbi:MAG: IclR family transcriptional regulator [Deltaproteobacteria bacterium]|jgi:DNA-binding IclR family transcriptional regulator|nr:IclR family transcriptional regulator [Deltaproteobacteria bacterium]